jgi:hypothetical protein
MSLSLRRDFTTGAAYAVKLSLCETRAAAARGHAKFALAKAIGFNVRLGI